MRNITRDSLNAFMHGRNFSRQNMTVVNTGEFVIMQLHGNHIARYQTSQGTDSLEISNAGWFSNTTKERLNAVLRECSSWGMYQEKGDWILCGQHGQDISWDGDWLAVSYLRDISLTIRQERAQPIGRKITVIGANGHRESFHCTATKADLAARVAQIESLLPGCNVIATVSHSEVA